MTQNARLTHKLIHTLARLIGFLLATCLLGHAGVALAEASSCDPTKASCIAAPGGGGSCTPLKQALGQCTPGGGGLGGGGSSGDPAPMCSAPPGGNPSCGGGPATTGSSGPSSGAGNPINLLNGNKYQEETDLPALPGVLGLELRRYYNSQSSHPGLLGANWRMSYESVLYDFGGEIQILQADGRRLMFERGIGAHATLCSSPQPQDGQVRIEAPADGRGPPTYHWRWADGRTLTFSGGSGGGFPLQAITAASGERLTLSYGPSGELTNIRDPQGRKLVFIYAGAAETAAQHRSRALKAIDTPLGRLTYTQDSLGRLTEVAQAKDANSAPYLTRLYHYEDRYNGGHPLALTGISIRGADPQTGQINVQRLSTYAYNSAGLAILSTKGRPKEVKDGKQTPDTGIEQVEVQYLVKALPVDSKVDRKTGEVIPTQFGRAILTNSLGQQTQVTSAVIGGHYRLVEMRGAGCSTCGPADMRYAYDRAGLLMRATQLDRDGRPIRSEITELDKYGRTARMGLQTYAGGKAESTRWIERYEYPDVTYRDGSVAVAPRPSLIARPSVVEGREHTVATSYNEFGQVTQMTEMGFSPVDDAGRIVGVGVPLSRTISTSYQVVNARSLPTRIDGPLAHDVTRLQWDSGGRYLVAITLPGELTVWNERDENGRITRQIDADGVSTRYDYGVEAPTKPYRTERAGQRLSYKFDLFGRIVQISDSGARRLKLRYDLAGHVVASIDAQGYKAQATLDTEGHSLIAGLYEPERKDPLRATYRWYDERQRIVKQLRADGRVDTWEYNAAGEVVEHTDGDDVLHLARIGDFGRQARIDLAPDGLMNIGINAKAPMVDPMRNAERRDDFGRIVLEWRPEQGLELRSYDGNDHLVRQERFDRETQPAGHVDQAFNTAGQLAQQLTYDSKGQRVHTVERKYRGSQLTSQRDDVQRNDYSYDESGRLIRTVVTLLDERRQPVYSTTLTTELGADGQSENRTLADGKVMRIERSPTGVATGMTLQSPFWASMHERIKRWLPPKLARIIQGYMPLSTILKDIAFHPYNGVTHYLYGNGVTTDKEFDIAGRLTALTVDNNRTILNYGVGPRIRSIEDKVQRAAPLQVRYQYDGFGVLRSEEAPRLTRTALESQSQMFGVSNPRTAYDTLGRATVDGRHRYDYTESGQIEKVKDLAGRVIVTYRYNAQGQRVSKLFAGGKIVYYLWDKSRLVAEVDGSGPHQGGVAVQYLYLVEGDKDVPVAKLESDWAQGNITARSRILYVHADHRGQPVCMTDEVKTVVWRAHADALGFIKPADITEQSAVMNLRLPGQYFDRETELHDNWHRSYDARPGSSMRGNYLTPDPVGYQEGPDPYAYVRGDPVNHVDPTGLYQIDVHYYMTYFLAVAAGMKTEDAQSFASAAQYVDDNPNTEPINITSFWTQETRLARYHFTLWKYADASHSIDKIVYNSSADISDPLSKSNQLTDLKSYAIPTVSKDVCLAPTDESIQFMGEFLHSFEDTYAHRDNKNVPIPIYGGVGHLFYGSNPDYTYDHSNPVYDAEGNLLGYDQWQTNESRTLKMETDTYSQIVGFMTQRNFYASGRISRKTMSFASVKEILLKFNATQENDQNASGFMSADTSLKIKLLNSQLAKSGFGPIPIYNVYQACRNRADNLRGLTQNKYSAAILQTPTSCPISN